MTINQRLNMRKSERTRFVPISSQWAVQTPSPSDMCAESTGIIIAFSWSLGRWTVECLCATGPVSVRLLRH